MEMGWARLGPGWFRLGSRPIQCKLGWASLGWVGLGWAWQGLAGLGRETNLSSVLDEE